MRLVSRPLRVPALTSFGAAASGYACRWRGWRGSRIRAGGCCGWVGTERPPSSLQRRHQVVCRVLAWQTLGNLAATPANAAVSRVRRPGSAKQPSCSLAATYSLCHLSRSLASRGTDSRFPAHLPARTQPVVETAILLSNYSGLRDQAFQEAAHDRDR
jgi:hypothetical protein